MIPRLYELRRHTRDADVWVWQLWLEGTSANIRVWVKKRLSKPRRSNLYRLTANRVRRSADRDVLMAWGAHIAAGRAQQASIYTAEPAPIFEILVKAAGLPSSKSPYYGSGPIPDRELRVEQMSVAHLSGIIDGASDVELGQALLDCQAISDLAATAEAVDWGPVSTAIELPLRALIGSGMPPSKLARRAKRTRPLPPPEIVTTLLAMWHDLNSRAALLPFLIHLRRSQDHSRRLSEILTLAGWALARFPGRAIQAGNAEAGTVEPEPHP